MFLVAKLSVSLIHTVVKTDSQQPINHEKQKKKEEKIKTKTKVTNSFYWRETVSDYT